MKKNSLFLLIAFTPFILNSCTKSGGLTGGTSSSGSFGSSISGSVNGGLSNVAGATVSLYAAGNATPLASATTASNGAFSIAFTNPGGTSLLYLKSTGGNAGSGTNSNNQFITIAGTTAAPLSSLMLNELTTAATLQIGLDLGILQDSSGTITLSAPAGANGVTNAGTQFNNLIANGNLNTGNSNLTSGTQTGLKAMANDLASCIENPSKCSTLFSTAVSTTSAAASSVLESGVNAITNSSTVGASLYSIAFPLSNSTGFTLTSSSAPGGFTFANPLPISINTYGGGLHTLAVAFDGSGNAYVGDITTNTITKFSSSGTKLLTISTNVGFIQGLAIDAAGNIWEADNGGALREYSPSGSPTQSILVSGNPHNAIIDPSGNIWIDTSAALREYNASGTLLQTVGVTESGTCCQDTAMDASGSIWVNDGSNGVIKVTLPSGIVGTFSTGCSGAQDGIAIDASGNIWNLCSGTTVSKISPAGSVLGTFSAGSSEAGIAIDASGNVWISNGGSGATELNASGNTIATYSISGIGNNINGLAVDPSGNLWVTGWNANVYVLPGVAVGPNFFPYSGPIWP